MDKNKMKGWGRGRLGLLLAGLLPALALGATMTVEYDPAGRIAAEVDANGNRTTYAYDQAGRRTASTDALGHTRRWAYDAAGNLIGETDPLGHPTTYTLDALGHRTAVTYADGTTATTAYDALGRVTTQTDANQRATTFTYDALGHLVQVQDALGQLTRYAYDEQGRKVRQTDANGHATAWSVDANGQVLTHTLPLGQVEAFRYDGNGAVLSHTDFNGQVTTYAYDVNGRVSDVRYADTGRTLTTYDAVGNRLRVDDTQVTAAGVAYSTRTTYTYDARDRLLQQGNPDGSGLAYSYDANGNRLSVTSLFPNGTSSNTAYAVDALNRVVSVTGPEGVSRYGYDADGNQVLLHYANGAEVRYAYDPRHRLIRQEHVGPTQVLTQRYVYTLDPTGRRLGVDELDGRHTAYQYDALYRLTSERQSGGSDAPIAASYQYDAVGNRTYSTIDGVQTAYTYDANDRLLTQGGETYTYDAAGSLRTRTLDGQVTTYGYDARGQMNQVGGPNGNAQYLYDVDHNRIQAASSGQATAFLIDSTADYPQVVAELNNGVPQIRYTLGHERLAQATASDFHFYETDGHGSVRALTGSDGGVTDRYRYDAFGNLLGQSGTTRNDFRYTGEQFDGVSGLYYLRARHYSPHSGRFTQRDSWEGNAQEPASLHKYAFGNGDPVNRRDPTGRSSLVEMEVVNTIQSELIHGEIDTGFDMLDRLTDGQSGAFVGDAQMANQGLMLGIAAIGSFDLLKMLSGKIRKACNSFDGETLVHTREGLRPIKDVRIGDEVLAFNERTGKEEYSKVVHLIQSDKEQGWVDIKTQSGEVIRATAEHPFYARTESDALWHWLDAAGLTAGARLYSAEKPMDMVLDAKVYSVRRPAYNLTVDTSHTYFVGQKGLLVHNSACSFGPGMLTNEAEAMSDRAARYQRQVTGMPEGMVYRVGDVKFDGFRDGKLIDAKGLGYESLVQNAYLAERIAANIIDQAERQVRAARGTPIIWYIAESGFADGVRNVLRNAGIRGIEVVFKAPEF